MTHLERVGEKRAAVGDAAPATGDVTCPPFVLHTRVVTGAGGGPDKTILNSPRMLRLLGFQSACMFLRPPNDSGFAAIQKRAVDWGSPIVEVDDKGPLDWRIVRNALQICRSHNVKIWHAHDYKTNLLGLIVKRWHAMQLVTTVHGWVELTWKTRCYHQLDRWSLKRYERVVCVSPDLLEQCRGFGVREDRSLLIENAIDTEQFRRRRSTAEAKRTLGLPEDVPLIGAVGRLSPEKAFDHLIAAVAMLHTAGPKPMLVIVGEGDQLSNLQALADQHGLSSHVRFAGFQSDTQVWYEAMDVFALSSLREGLPNVVLEAMALETPVVATRVAGVPRLVEDGVSGLVVPIGDVPALAAALKRLLNEDSLRRLLASAARQVIESRYSFAVRMAKMATVYASIGVKPANQ